MPILITPEVVEPVAPVARDVVDVTFTLSQGGQDLELSGIWQVQAGVEGLDDPPLQLTTSSAAAVLGEFPGAVVASAREVFLPVLVRAPGGAAWRAAKDALRLVANPLNGSTRIAVATQDGRTRVIDGWRDTRDAITWAVDTWGHDGWQRLGLLFRCPSPWWRDLAAVRLGPWRVSSGVGFLGPQFLPVHLGQDMVLGDEVLIDVPGQVQTWPTWVISGAVESVTATHEDTGREWVLDCTGLTGPITVVTDPITAAVTDGAGASQWQALAAPFDLWPLTPGSQRVTVTVVGADATTEVSATADALHLAAL